MPEARQHAGAEAVRGPGSCLAEPPREHPGWGSVGTLGRRRRGLDPACPLDSGLPQLTPLGPGNSSGGLREGPDGRSVCRLAPGVPVSQEWTELRMPVAPRSHGWLRAKPEASLAVPTYNFAGVFDSGAGSLAIFTA